MLDSLEILRRHELIHDDGPIYYEFIADAIVKEPWNAFSSLAFFIPVIFWIWKLRGQYKDNLIIVALLPFLFLNGLGSTLFHAFRKSDFFLVLDWLPAALMSLLLTTYLWSKALGKWYWGLLTVAGFYTASFTTYFLIQNYGGSEDLGINIGYLFTGLCLIVPLMMILRKTKWDKGWLVLISFILLGLALVFRATDYPSPNPFSETLPQGTHFMWHILSSFAVFTLGYYLYFLNKMSFGLRSKE